MVCRNRTHYLEQTIHDNLEVQKRHNINFILVNYGSTDHLDQFVQTELTEPIQQEALKYYKYAVDSWHVSKAKNMSHLLADGYILFNLDCDNFISDDLCESLLKLFDENSNVIVQNSNKPNISTKNGIRRYTGDGTYGRIAITSQNFQALGGYDESFECMGYQDTDLIRRAKLYGLQTIKIKEHAKAIVHPKCEGLQISVDELRAMDKRNKLLCDRNLVDNLIVANSDINVTAAAEKAQRIYF